MQLLSKRQNLDFKEWVGYSVGTHKTKRLSGAAKFFVAIYFKKLSSTNCVCASAAYDVFLLFFTYYYVVLW